MVGETQCWTEQVKGSAAHKRENSQSTEYEAQQSRLLNGTVRTRSCWSWHKKKNNVEMALTACK
jgi:hypothetical protein